jgi:hypothetical protein
MTNLIGNEYRYTTIDREKSPGLTRHSLIERESETKSYRTLTSTTKSGSLAVV